MSKKKGGKKMSLLQRTQNSRDVSKHTRTVRRSSDKLSSMSKDDMIEWNNQSKKNRGLSSLKFDDLFKESN